MNNFESVAAFTSDGGARIESLRALLKDPDDEVSEGAQLTLYTLTKLIEGGPEALLHG